MVPRIDPVDVVSAIADAVCLLIAGNLNEAERERVLDDVASCYAEQTDVRHPFAPLGDTPLRTRAELREHFAAAGSAVSGEGRVERFERAGVVTHRTSDPEVVVTEFHYRGTTHGAEFRVPAIFVMRIRDGQVVESRDYADHLALARAVGRLDPLLGAIAAR